ncbi:helix-turn-helix domain-containing protein [Sphingorhabdus sp.]|uniref:helix-turn-helix domain-containing protein n=1 Tax=Sphingorhabdus sp. TaxID=1902408 RepID=UPI003982F41F
MSELADASPVNFILPAPPLRRYLSTYYFVDTGTDDTEHEDFLYPEWAAIRFTMRGAATGNIVGLDPLSIPDDSVTGPTGKAALVRFRNVRLVGIGLLPLGWYRIVGCPADRWANRVTAVDSAPEFAVLARLRREIEGLNDPEQIAALFDHLLLQVIASPDPLEADIECIHQAIANPEISNVGELSEATAISTQRLERLSRRVFGFPPKLLLRRQRFLRTMATAMEHPELKWSDALDRHYFDQAHFNREFHQFMGMSPGQYLAMPRLISIASNRERAHIVGQLLQALQIPAPQNGQ